MQHKKTNKNIYHQCKAYPGSYDAGSGHLPGFLHMKEGEGLQIDLFDPLKPFHRLTNGPGPSKTIETNGWATQKPLKNHRWQWSEYQKTFNGDGVLQNN